MEILTYARRNNIPIYTSIHPKPKNKVPSQSIKEYPSQFSKRFDMPLPPPYPDLLLKPTQSNEEI